MRCPIFDAKFISKSEFAPACPLFRKKFTSPEKISSATLYISALGIFEANINGVRVGDDYMAPGWTCYEKRVQYFTYDVTDMLQGENTLTVGVGNGWFASRGGFTYSVGGMYNPFPAMICALEMIDAEGKSTYVLSDESFDAARSAVTFSGIYDGETYDAEAAPEFNAKADIFEYDKSTLIPKEGESTKEIERVGVKRIIKTPKDEWVLDFGQEVTGTVEFVVQNARGGETLVLEHGEILDKDGNFYNENYRTAKAKLEYKTAPGWQTYKAKYTFFGFRYVRLTGWCEEIKKENFCAVVMHSEMKRTGYFKCGHAKINKLYSNVIWGQKDNFLDIPTDCPQRDERLGWTGDAQVFARTASLNFDTEKFFTKWLRDMQASQYEDGGIPYVIPNALTDEEKNGAAWSDAACIIPWEVYRAYGNKALLREHLPMMKKWLGYMYNAPGRRYLWEGGKQFGDWLGLDAPEGSYAGSTNKDLIATAYYYLCAKLVGAACRELDLKSEKYENIATRVKSAFKKEFIKRGKLISDTQTAHVVTLHFGLVDDEPVLKKKLADRLIKLIEDNGNALTTGFVGTPYLLDTLTEIGRTDKAYTLLYREQFPGWLFSVNMGATTIWEHWDGLKEDGSVWSVNMNSFNHYAYGSVASWFYGTILGIKPTTAGYKSITLTPHPSKTMGFAKGRIDTRIGTVTSEWVYEDGYVRYSFEIPEGCVAELTLPDGTRETLRGGRYVRWSEEV